MLEEHELEYVLKVAEVGSFSQAARELYVTQPSLSQSIKKLETELGIELFDRRLSPLRLTCAGEIYVAKAKEIRHIRDELLRSIDDLAEMKQGHLRIGTSYSRTNYLLTLVLPKFRALYPGIEISLIEGSTYELQEFALNDRTDISFTYLPFRYAKLAYQPIIAEQVLAALPPEHRLSRQYGADGCGRSFPEIDFSELASEEFIIMKERRKMRQLFFNLCEQCGFKPKVLLETQSLMSAQALVGAGVGATLVTDTLALFHRLEQNPCYFALKNMMERRELVVAYHSENRLSKAAQAFIDLTLQILSQKNI